MKDFQKNQRGQLLLEVLVSSTLVTVGIVGIIVLLTSSISSAKVVSSQYVAANLAAEGIELVKSVIDSDYLAGKSFGCSLSTGTYAMDYNDLSLRAFANQVLLFNPTSQLYSYDSGDPTPFVRRLEIDTAPDETQQIEHISVISVVEWKIRTAEFKVEVEDHFFDWKNQTGGCGISN